MTSRAKKTLKRAVKRTEVPCWVVTILGYPVCIAGIVWASPTVTTTQLAVLQLFIGFTSGMAAWAGTIKTDDTEE